MVGTDLYQKPSNEGSIWICEFRNHYKNKTIQHFIAFKQNLDVDSGDSGNWWLLLIINILIILQLQICF